MTISFAKFVKMLDPSCKIPEYMKSFIRDMKSNKRYCVSLHRRAGRKTLMEHFKENECH